MTTYASPPGYAAQALPAPGWYPDPQGIGETRWWDGTQWTTALKYSGALPPGTRWRPLGGLARAVTVLLVLSAFAHAAAALAFRDRVTTVERFRDFFVGPEDLSASDRLVVAAVLAVAAIGIVTFVLWVVWFRAAYRDAETFRRIRFRGWAVMGWIVPIVSLYRPKQMVNDVWIAGEKRYDSAVTRPRAPMLVQLWWLTWLGGTLVASVGYTMARPAAEPEDKLEAIGTAAQVASVSHALLMLASVLGAFLVLRVTGRLQRRHSDRTAPPSTGTAQPLT